MTFAAPETESRDRLDLSARFCDTAVLIFLIGYFLTSLWLLTDFGPGMDSQKNFAEGQAHLDFLLGGGVDSRVVHDQTHGAFLFIVADASRRILNEWLGLLDPVAARFVVLPVLSTLFGFCLYRFVRRHWDAATGLFAVVVLMTCPYYFGHSFGNIKDVSLLIFISLTIFAFVNLFVRGSTRYLYAFFCFWALSLSIKAYALIVPLILLPWAAACWRLRARQRSLGLLHLFLAPAVGLTLLALFCCPAVWGIADKAAFVRGWWSHSSWFVTVGPGWNLFSLEQIGWRLPILFVLSGVAGIVCSLMRPRSRQWSLLLLIWLAVPVALPCLPRISHYNGLRHYLVFLVPMSILAALALRRLPSRLPQHRRGTAARISAALLLLLVLVNVHADLRTHPYQTTFFNLLAGGLGRAQQRQVEDSYEYWMTSYREAAAWLDAHATPGATVHTVYFAALPERYTRMLLRFSLERSDLQIVHSHRIRQGAGGRETPLITSGSYVLIAPSPFQKATLRRFDASVGPYELVHEIRRQGGVILRIYRKL